MGRLSDHIEIAALSARSVNLERDVSAEDLHGYIPTARAIDTLRRILSGLQAPSGTRAWSVTGPYGSGKSSFAMLLDALCAPDEPLRRAASRLLSPIAPDVVELADQFVESRSAPIRATTIARIEAVGTTVARALQRGATRRWPTRMPSLVKDALRQVADRPSFPHIRIAIDAMAGFGPVVVTIDEFGKNLEHHATGDPGDLFLLQELAELFSGASRARVGGLITLQHLGFDDYASALSVSGRREWAKVQGRFEDISFVDSPDQVVRLIADTIRQEPQHRPMARRFAAWSALATSRAEELGLIGYFGDKSLVGRCFPVHPVAAAALPEICSRYGQYERTLVSFLASDEPDSVSAFCKSAPDSDPLSTVGLVEVFDYFVTAARTLTGVAADAARWLEIEGRVNDALVDDEDLDILKVVGVLNLISDNGSLRASTAMVSFALDLTMERADEIRRRLSLLAERGVIAFRSFSDEYRLWSGTDFDVSGAIASARELLGSTSPAGLLSDATSPTPVIAGRHSQRTGILRYFDVVYADAANKVEIAPSLADGTIVYVVAGNTTPSVVGDGRPVVLASSPYLDEPVAAVRELAAITNVLRERAGDLAADWVARRELNERAGQARAALVISLAQAFDPARAGVSWSYEHIVVESRRGPSGVLSVVCDEVFHATPHVRNEMIARRELTSQGAKARRVVLESMLAHEDEKLLGFEGYGPERAIYHAVLEEPGFHRVRSDGTYRFGAPLKNSDWSPVWGEIAVLFTEAEVEKVGVRNIYDRLGSPPFGIKAGVIPVLLTVGLLARRDDIAIYEDGTYQPRLTADLLERLVHNPDRFAIKNFAAATGERRYVVERLGKALNIDVTPSDRRRNSGVLALMSPLMNTIRALPEFTLVTRDMREETVAVRDVLVSACEPDQLLFRELPGAVGISNTERIDLADRRVVARYAQGLAAAVVELGDNWATLLRRIEDQLRSATATPNSGSLRGDLAARAHHLVDRVLDPRLRSFLVTACEESLEDEDWIVALALIVVDKPPVKWRDGDWPAFVAAAGAIGGTLKRLEALNYDHIAQGSTEFTARRFTLTNPDGTETSTIVVIDPAVDDAVEAYVSKVALDAERALAPSVVPAFVARLVEALLVPEEGVERPSEELRRHG